MCVTSPPYYGLRDYGGEEKQIGQEQTPEQYIENLVQVFRSVRDVLTDDGTCWVILAIVTIITDLEGDKDWQNKVSQIQNKTYLMCVLAEEIDLKDSKKKI